MVGVMEKVQQIMDRGYNPPLFYFLLNLPIYIFLINDAWSLDKSWKEFVVFAVLFLANIPFYIIRVVKKCERARYLLWILLGSAFVALCGGCISLWVDKLNGFEYLIFPAISINIGVLLYGVGYMIWVAVKKNPVGLTDIWTYTLPIFYFPFLVNSAISL